MAGDEPNDAGLNVAADQINRAFLALTFTSPTSSTGVYSMSSNSPPAPPLVPISSSNLRSPSTPTRTTHITSSLNPAAMAFTPSPSSSRKRKASPTSPFTPSKMPLPTQGPTISFTNIFDTSTRTRFLRYFQQVTSSAAAMDNDWTFDSEYDEPSPSSSLSDYSPARYFDRTRASASSNSKYPPSAVMLFQLDAASTSTIRYLPLQLSNYATPFPQLVISHDTRRAIDAAGDTTPQSTFAWPKDRVPAEIFDLITTLLTREDLKAMRLVSKDFESKVSRALFHTSVVPFNTELYDMIDDDAKVKAYEDSNDAVMTRSEPVQLHWKNAKEDEDGKVYNGHGLKVFQGFGTHIRRFGMSFEVSERQLSCPPSKRELDRIDSYFGSYDWPRPDYCRFARLAGLEKVADDTSRMRAAFANLDAVQQLGLSVDSGLGWLRGPDKSIRATLLPQRSPIFEDTPDDRIRRPSLHDAKCFWEALQSSFATMAPARPLYEQNLHISVPRTPLQNWQGLKASQYAQSSQWPCIDAKRVEESCMNPPSSLPTSGVIYLSSDHDFSPDRMGECGVSPNDLKKQQKEWLLETEWAQRAFLESYMLSIIHNPEIFSCVSTLTIAKISSGHLKMMNRHTFWDAMPSLADVTLKVSAGWRTVEKDAAGLAETRSLSPSKAVDKFHQFVNTHIAKRESIKKLHLGYSDGGENADGMFARNQNILPAPLCSLDTCLSANPGSILVFPYVETLTLSNCWMTPPALEMLVRSHSQKALKSLILDSFSLTACPRTSHAAAAAANAAAFPAGAVNPPPPAAVHQTTASTGQQLPNLQFLPQITNFTFNHGPFWTRHLRPGTWPVVLHTISPGDNLDPFESGFPHQQQQQQEIRQPTNLRRIELKSVGYVKLPLVPLNQFFIEPAHGTYSLSLWFKARHSLLSKHMLPRDDRHLATIVQWMSRFEVDTMNYVWDMTEGWEDAEAAEAVLFDGLLPGGTGRMSGIIEKEAAE